MAVCGREAARQRMLRRPAARLGEERACIAGGVWEQSACCHPALLEYIFIYTPALLVLYSYLSCCACVCVCRRTGLVECVEESEGLRRDGAWEHGVLQQRPARQVPLHHPPHVSLLTHFAAAQARTRMRQEREMRRFVCPAEQVRVGWRRRRMSCPLTRPSSSLSNWSIILSKVTSILGL